MMLSGIVILAAVAFSAAEEMHTTLDDTHDLEAIVKDPEALLAFTLCFIERGPCNELTFSFKKNMKEAVFETCRRCNDDQRHIFNVYLTGLEKNNQQMYQEYCKFYDPKGDKMPLLRKALAPF